MKGFLLLEGGAEFGGSMSASDLRAIELAGGFEAPLRIIPAAAAPDHNDRRAGSNGVRWFTSLGATQVASLALIDRDAANNEEIAAELRKSRLIYMLGGFPGYLFQTLSGSLSWSAALAAYRTGAVLGGSSAGAMVLCQHLYDPEARTIGAGLDLIHNACFIPHHDTFGKSWAPRLALLIPEAVLIGIDEQTGMIDDALDGRWTVYGRGTVTLYRAGKTEVYRPGDTLAL